jgi:hypothetical protein
MGPGRLGVQRQGGAVSLMLALASSGGGTLTTKTFVYTGSAAQPFVVPSNVATLALVSGQGAAGSPAYSSYHQQYSVTTTTYNQRNDNGGTITSTNQGTTYNNGPTPADYCSEKVPVKSSFDPTITNYTWNCYDYTDTSHYDSSAATTGQAATGFGQTFPGGYAGPATPVSFQNVAVTPGQTYQVFVPYGGSITISYYA